MRIVIVSHSADVTGGAELCLLETARALQTRHEVFVVVRRSGPLRERLIEQGTKVRTATYAYWLGKRPLSLFATLSRTAGTLGGLPGLLTTLQSLKPDVIVSNTIAIGAGAVAAAMLNVPHAWYIHEFGDRAGGVGFDFGFPMARALLNRSAVVLATSRALAAHYAAAGVKAPFAIVPNAACVRTPQRPASRRAALELIMSGHISESKCQHDAVSALGMVRRAGVDARLTLLGTEEPAYARWLRDLVAREGLTEFVELPGFIATPEDRVASADVSLTCSAEGFGRSTVEAMKLGCAVIGANRDATAELIEDGVTGLLYPPGDVTKLAEKILAMADPVLRARLAAEAQRFALAEFNLDRHACQLERALGGAIRRSPGG